MSTPQTIDRQGDTVLAGGLGSACDRVANFYAAYLDAICDHTDDLSTRLRTHYLTTDLQQRVDAWEQTNDADGCLRSQDMPTHWDVCYHDAGMNHVYTTVTLTCGTGSDTRTTRLAVRSRLDQNRISDIENAPAGW